MIFIFILSLITNTSLAEDCVSCTNEFIPFDGLIKNVQGLQSPTVVNCENELLESAKLEYLANYGKLTKHKGTVKGLTLEGSAEEIKYLNKMLGDNSNDKWSEASGCATVLCALTRVYDSEEAAYRVLNIAKRDGYIISLAKDFNFDKGPMGQLFSLEELQKIDLSYMKLPAGFKKLKTLDRIKRLPDGYTDPKVPKAAAFASPAYHALLYDTEGEITFLMTGTKGGVWGPLVAVHELTHHVDFSRSTKTPYGVSESPEFLKLSGWKKIKKYETDKKTGNKVAVDGWEHAPNKNFITDYAGTEPAEDLAEAGAHYMFYPKKFKETDPEKYEFIKKNIFDGKEFLSEPDLGIPDQDILKMCFENQKEFNLYGDKKYFNASISSSCLDNFVDDVKYTDPKLCSLSPEQINNYLFDKISPAIQNANESLKNCDENLESYMAKCMNEGDFQQKCPIERCNLQSPIKEKIKYRIIGAAKQAEMKAAEAKLGRQNFLATALISGLSDKSKIYSSHALNVQKYFLENATAGLAAKFEKEKFKFDSKEVAISKSQTYLMMDKSSSSAVTNFQESVLKNASRSKEKNLALVKAWATSQSLEDTPMYDELAETLTKYGSFSKK